MALLLHIDTATPIGSVCLSKDGEKWIEKMSMKQRSHASVVVPFIKEIMDETGTKPHELDAIVISGGPGSYTGLRVATSTAKGLCYAYDIPLIAISTLKMMAYGVQQEHPEIKNACYCPMIDARRKEVFTARYDAHLNEIVPPKAAILEEDFFKGKENKKIVIVGTGQKKAQELLKATDNLLFPEYTCKSSHLIPLAEKAFAEKKFEDVAYFEPFYLKSVYLPNVKKG